MSKNKYLIKLASGEIIDGMTRREVLGLMGISDEYNNSSVKKESGNDDWLPIIDWANKDYLAMADKKHFYFEGEEPVWWEKLMALSFLYPKKWRLLSFELLGDKYTLKFGDGKTAEFIKGNFEAKINIDKQFRRKIDIKTGNEKYGFFESLMGYADTDFDLIVMLLEAKESELMKFTVGLDNFNRALRRSITKNY